MPIPWFWFYTWPWVPSIETLVEIEKIDANQDPRFAPGRHLVIIFEELAAWPTGENPPNRLEITPDRGDCAGNSVPSTS